MDRRRTNFVGLFLILGAALGYGLGLAIADPGVAAVYGAAGGGLGVVVGAIVTSLASPARRTPR